MNAYLDTSLLVSVFLIDVHSKRAQGFVAGLSAAPTISSWTIAEFSSAVAARLRAKSVTDREAAEALALFDRWVNGVSSVAVVTDDDIRASAFMVRRPNIALKTPDALHIAICRRLGRQLATIDAQMALAATALGVAVAAT